ncbi:oxalurate catabolism protein HpxZ [Cupriavidus sp. PET2-C1]
MRINDPAILAEVEAAFEAYERALVGNDVAELDRLFWESPHTLRYGAGENLYGIEAIRAFRAARPAKGLAREITERSVTTFGNDFAVANIAGEPRLGRQSQSWVRLPEGWQVVAAHVSWQQA